MEEFSVFPGRMRRLGVVMQPDATDEREVEGVLNPAVVRGRDGHLYLLPRLVGAGNYSRIGLARVLFSRHGYPVGVDRLGVVLEPEASYERNPRTRGGVEDPRIVYIAARGVYIMLYTAYGPLGPRIACAISRNLFTWRRLGLVHFAPRQDIDFGALHNKDALLFPEPVPGPDGRPSVALIHRPVFTSSIRGMPPLQRPSMWISYASLDDVVASRHITFANHQLLVSPQFPWERLKVGGGTPPMRVSDGWLIFYHGVSGRIVDGLDQQPHVRYSAGALLLDPHDPRRILARSVRSVLVPRTGAERFGIVPRVVFPTGIDVRAGGVLDIYYGMADSRIGVARCQLASAGELLTAKAA